MIIQFPPNDLSYMRRTARSHGYTLFFWEADNCVWESRVWTMVPSGYRFVAAFSDGSFLKGRKK